MNAHSHPIAADLGLTAEELAELAREEAEYDWREQMAEIAQHNRAVREGEWTLDDWLEWSPCGRGYAAAHARSSAFEACDGEGSCAHRQVAAGLGR